MADNPLDDINPQMDVSNLYTEELITDRKVGTIHVLTPINTDGTRDTQRPMLFLGETNLMTQMGPLPISFEIPAQNVAEAVAGMVKQPRRGFVKRLNVSSKCVVTLPTRLLPRGCLVSRRLPLTVVA